MGPETEVEDSVSHHDEIGFLVSVDLCRKNVKFLFGDNTPWGFRLYFGTEIIHDLHMNS